MKTTSQKARAAIALEFYIGTRKRKSPIYFGSRRRESIPELLQSKSRTSGNPSKGSPEPWIDSADGQLRLLLSGKVGLSIVAREIMTGKTEDTQKK